MAIKSFLDRATEEIATGIVSKKSLKLLPVQLHPIAYRRIIYLDNAQCLQDLLNWQSLRLEKLKGSRAGQFSIRINDQFRICFRWIDNCPHNVQIVDYH